MNPLFQRIVDAGWFDRIVNWLFGTGKKRVVGTEKWFLDKSRELREQAGFDFTGGWGAWREVVESARLTVNSQRNREKLGEEAELPGANQVPCLDRPGERCDGTMEYRLIVSLIDPVTGATTRIPVFLESPVALTRDRLKDLAEVAARDQAAEYNGRVKGAFSPDRAKIVDLYISGINSRST